MTGDRNYGEIVGTGKAQDLKQNTQLLAQGGGHFGDRGEETCKGTERAQIILVGRERVQKGKMICDNPVPLNSRCSGGGGSSVLFTGMVVVVSCVYGKVKR